ncbi:transposable element Tc1 transposase [Trichonephila clavipes]|nr:transposable element Tc1 transposase [Trichonephila clavipes]
MTAYKKCGNVTSGKHSSGRKRKLTDRDKRVLTRIVARKRKQSLSQITSEVNSPLRNPISARTVQRELHASNLYGRVGIRKPLVTARHALQRRQWCRTHRQWTPQQWQQVIWSHESTFTLFQTTGRVYVWRTAKEAFAPECIVPTLKHGCGYLMVHPFVQTSFPGECPLYQDDNAPIHTAKIVQEWFVEHEGEEGHFDWPPQSPDLNIIEHSWVYLESKLRARFPPPSTILALETALHEEWLHIPLQVVHDLYASIPHVRIILSPICTVVLVLFSDEPRFCVQHLDGGIRVRRPKRECTQPACIPYHHTGPAPSIIIWTGIGYTTRTPFVRVVGDLNSYRYISQILRAEVAADLRSLVYIILHQGNAKPHIAYRILAYFYTEYVQISP